MSVKLDFVGVGNIAYDLVVNVDQLPIKDGKYPTGPVRRFPGGMIANATCAAAQLGLACGYVGWVAHDEGGAILTSDFDQRGVLTNGIEVVPNEMTPFTIILVTPNGERVILLPPSNLYDQPLSNYQLTFASGTRVIYTHPRDVQWCKTLANIATKSGALFVLDVEHMGSIEPEEMLQIIADADIVFVGRETIERLGLKSIADLHARVWGVMTVGSGGVWGYSTLTGEEVHQSAFRVNAIDTTGAGDCFHAALIFSYLKSDSLSDALRFASAAAAIAVQYPGARGGLPSADEVQEWLATQ